MTTLDKLKIIETLPDISVSDINRIGEQSIQVCFKCGCNFVQHGYSHNPIKINPKIDSKNYDTILADRTFFVILCNLHNE